MPDVGDSAIAQLQVDPFSTDTVATLQVISPAGVATAAAVTATAANHLWSAAVTYDQPGLWQLRWTVTGTGAGEETQLVTVGPQGGTVPGRTYATTADLAGYLGTAPPPGASRMLRDATTLIDRLLIAAVYDVDGDDMPTDPKTAAALRDATCELVNWWVQTADPYGARAVFGRAQIGSVSVSAPGVSGRGATHSQAQQTRIGPQVVTILENAGLVGQAPVSW